MRGKTQLPRYAQIEPVGRCNLACRMCPVRFRDEPGERLISFATFTRLVDTLPLDELHLQGLGEPLAHPRFFDMVAYAVGRGIRVSTNTNLTLLTPAKAERCITSGIHAVHISIDGATAATYERIRTGARFDRLERNIRRLVAAKARAASTSPELSLTSVAMRENVAELPALVRRAAEWSIPVVNVQHLSHDFGEPSLPAQYLPMRSYTAEQKLDPADPLVTSAFAEARAEAQRLGIELRLPQLEPKHYPPATPGRVRCAWPWTGAYVAWDGRAMPCCMIATPDRLTLGDVERDAFDEVWNGAAYGAFRDALDSTSDPPAVCRSCSLYTGTF